jgi:hypothetical protein
MKKKINTRSRHGIRAEKERKLKQAAEIERITEEREDREFVRSEMLPDQYGRHTDAYGYQTRAANARRQAQVMRNQLISAEANEARLTARLEDPARNIGVVDPEITAAALKSTQRTIKTLRRRIANEERIAWRNEAVAALKDQEERGQSTAAIEQPMPDKFGRGSPPMYEHARPRTRREAENAGRPFRRGAGKVRIVVLEARLDFDGEAGGRYAWTPAEGAEINQSDVKSIAVMEVESYNEAVPSGRWRERFAVEAHSTSEAEERLREELGRGWRGGRYVGGNEPVPGSAIEILAIRAIVPYEDAEDRK